MERSKHYFVSLEWWCVYSLCRLAYAVYMIDALMERHKCVDLYVTYDIACTLQRHLTVSCVQ